MCVCVWSLPVGPTRRVYARVAKLRWLWHWAVLNVHTRLHTDSLTCTLSRYVARTLGSTHQPQQSTQPGAATSGLQWRPSAYRVQSAWSRYRLHEGRKRPQQQLIPFSNHTCTYRRWHAPCQDYWWTGCYQRPLLPPHSTAPSARPHIAPRLPQTYPNRKLININPNTRVYRLSLSLILVFAIWSAICFGGWATSLRAVPRRRQKVYKLTWDHLYTANIQWPIPRLF